LAVPGGALLQITPRRSSVHLEGSANLLLEPMKVTVSGRSANWSSAGWRRRTHGAQIVDTIWLTNSRTASRATLLRRAKGHLGGSRSLRE